MLKDTNDNSKPATMEDSHHTEHKRDQQGMSNFTEDQENQNRQQERHPKDKEAN